jgi:DNA-damage-inducible protein J
MANTVNLNIRVDSDLKRKAEAVYSELGMSLSTAMNVFLRSSVRYGGIPFDLRLDAYNAETLTAMDDVNSGHGLSKTFDSVDTLMEDLNA